MGLLFVRMKAVFSENSSNLKNFIYSFHRISSVSFFNLYKFDFHEYPFLSDGHFEFWMQFSNIILNQA